MSVYKFIKSEYRMRDELYHLWDNFEVLEFLEGYDYICKREREICECMPEVVAIDFIEGTRIDWILRDYQKS